MNTVRITTPSNNCMSKDIGTQVYIKTTGTQIDKLDYTKSITMYKCVPIQKYNASNDQTKKGGCFRGGGNETLSRQLC